ncbi:Protein fmp32, mitochondrial [Neocucurbitaria cava]|uniref:Protein fmp32, mitochondrial n=1 Tax=Neocucurbitaria cava TaxID=798079 RepID=A0A9W8Y8G6_9PLEO|nr:Protein fmp32, mitochondrial [Neocucurbitaria cava]
MVAPSRHATAIPRFLLPQLSWSAKATRPAALGALEARRHRSYAASDRRAMVSKPSLLQAQTIRQWKRSSPHYADGYASALEFRRNFSATAPQSKDHHFDTLKFVQRLKDEGFTEEQAEGMMKVLGDVIEESIQNLTRTMVLREDQEKATYTQKVDFAKLRSELMTADSTESSLTRASHERLTNELAKLNSRLRDEIQRTQASVRLDLNLEKGRIREEANVQELKLKETETRIEQETAQLRERLEAVKFSTLQWLMGVCTGTAALMLGVWRLLM